jgi:hypothetical protein
MAWVKGITGDPIIFGKTSHLEADADAIDILKSSKVKQITFEELPKWRQQLHRSETLNQDFLELEASKIANAKNSGRFYENHWLPYLGVLTQLII